MHLHASRRALHVRIRLQTAGLHLPPPHEHSHLRLHLWQEGFGSKPLHVALTSPKPPRAAKKAFGMMMPYGGAMGQPVFAAVPVANGQPGMMQGMGQWPNGAGQPLLLCLFLSCMMSLPSR